LHPLPHALHHQHVHAPCAGRPPAAGAAWHKNFAFISQCVEIPRDTVFTVELSVRVAQMAVYQLMGITKQALK
jgi:myosin-crossreactive antigen